MELTTKQAIYCLLSGSLVRGFPFFGYWTIKRTTEGLKTVFGIEVTREHTSRLVREIMKEEHLQEYEGRVRMKDPLYLPRERLFHLVKPGNILTARKWKRDGHQGQENSGKSKGNTNPV